MVSRTREFDLQIRQAVINVITAGFMLHVYTYAFKAAGGLSLISLGVLAFSVTPYIAPAILVARDTAKVGALGFAAGALVGDLYMHYSVFIAPKSSTAALGLLFMPIWNLILLGPTGVFVARLASAVWDWYSPDDPA